MTITNREYYCRRIEEESRRAEAETNSSVRHVHQTLANMYRVRLQAEERETRQAVQLTSLQPGPGLTEHA